MKAGPVIVLLVNQNPPEEGETMNRNRITAIAAYTVATLAAAAPVLASGHDDTVRDVAVPTVEAPTVETPSQLGAEVPETRTPSTATPSAATPAQDARASAPAAALPTQVTVDLDGAVDHEVQTPASTPEVAESAAVPSVVVEGQEVAGIDVPAQSVTVRLPGNLAASNSGMSAAVADVADGGASWDGEGSFDIEAEAEAADRTVSIVIG